MSSPLGKSPKCLPLRSGSWQAGGIGGERTHGPCPHRVAAEPEGGSGQSAGQTSLRTRACVAPTPDGLPVGTAAWTPGLGPPARSQVHRRSPWCCACHGGRGCSSVPPRVLCPPVPSPAPLRGSALASPWTEGDSDDLGTGWSGRRWYLGEAALGTASAILTCLKLGQRTESRGSERSAPPCSRQP